MVMGLWMVNVVFSLGHRLLNFQSARVTYFVNASLFIYLVHHPLTLFFGAYITPHIKSNLLGFLCGLLFVVGIAVILYEIHLRIPVLKFLFSGKPPVRQDKTRPWPVSFPSIIVWFRATTQWVTRTPALPEPASRILWRVLFFQYLFTARKSVDPIDSSPPIKT